MIGFFHGIALAYDNGVASFAVGDMGYEVHVSEKPTIWEPGASELRDLWWIHEVAPQDAPHELYGFRTREERDLFRRLLEVQGVGPKVAQRIVANKGVTESKSETGKLIAVESTLRAIRGVGPKLAQRIAEAFQ